MSATLPRSVPRVVPTQGSAEVTVVVEVRDLFERGDGRRVSGAAPEGGDVRQVDPSS